MFLKEWNSSWTPIHPHIIWSSHLNNLKPKEFKRAKLIKINHRDFVHFPKSDSVSVIIIYSPVDKLSTDKFDSTFLLSKFCVILCHWHCMFNCHGCYAHAWDLSWLVISDLLIRWDKKFVFEQERQQFNCHFAKWFVKIFQWKFNVRKFNEH